MAAGRGSTTTHFGRAAIATATVALCLGNALLPSPGQAQVPSTVTQTIGGALGGASHGGGLVGGTGGGLGGAVGGSTSGSSLGGGVSLGGNGRIMVRGGGSAGNGSNLYGSAGNTRGITKATGISRQGNRVFLTGGGARTGGDTALSRTSRAKRSVDEKDTRAAHANRRVETAAERTLHRTNSTTASARPPSRSRETTGALPRTPDVGAATPPALSLTVPVLAYTSVFAPLQPSLGRIDDGLDVTLLAIVGDGLKLGISTNDLRSLADLGWSNIAALALALPNVSTLSATDDAAARFAKLSDIVTSGPAPTNNSPTDPPAEPPIPSKIDAQTIEIAECWRQVNFIGTPLDAIDAANLCPAIPPGVRLAVLDWHVSSPQDLMPGRSSIAPGMGVLIERELTVPTVVFPKINRSTKGDRIPSNAPGGPRAPLDVPTDLDISPQPAPLAPRQPGERREALRLAPLPLASPIFPRETPRMPREGQSEGARQELAGPALGEVGAAPARPRARSGDELRTALHAPPPADSAGRVTPRMPFETPREDARQPLAGPAIAEAIIGPLRRPQRGADEVLTTLRTVPAPRLDRETLPSARQERIGPEARQDLAGPAVAEQTVRSPLARPRGAGDLRTALRTAPEFNRGSPRETLPPAGQERIGSEARQDLAGPAIAEQTIARPGPGPRGAGELLTALRAAPELSLASPRETSPPARQERIGTEARQNLAGPVLGGADFRSRRPADERLAARLGENGVAPRVPFYGEAASGLRETPPAPLDNQLEPQKRSNVAEPEIGSADARNVGPSRLRASGLPGEMRTALHIPSLTFERPASRDTISPLGEDARPDQRTPAASPTPAGPAVLLPPRAGQRLDAAQIARLELPGANDVLPRISQPQTRSEDVREDKKSEIFGPVIANLTPRIDIPKLTVRPFERLAVPDDRDRTRLFDPGALRSTPAAFEPWHSGEEPMLFAPRPREPADPDLKRTLFDPPTNTQTGGVTIARKGQVTGEGQRPRTPAELLGLAGETRVAAQRCLADAVYFESRGEPITGQIAVAQVVLNRAFSGFYPRDVCGVVYQNAHRYLACQFTFACMGLSLTVREPDARERAERIARDVLDGRLWVEDVGKSTHYHAYWVHPWWARLMKTLSQIGVHTFYRPYNWGDGSDAPAWGTFRIMGEKSTPSPVAAREPAEVQPPPAAPP